MTPGVISGALLFIPDDFKLTPFLQGAIVAGLLLGAMIGAAFAGRLSDRLGTPAFDHHRRCGVHRRCAIGGVRTDRLRC